MKDITASASIKDYDFDQEEQVSEPAISSVSNEAQPTWHEVRFIADRGVELCRQGEWKKGFEALTTVADLDRREGELPGAFYSYLGYGVARYQRKLGLGLALARHATEEKFFEPDNFLNLARVQLLMGNRRQAYRSLAEGLKLDPKHQALREVLRHMGWRKRPVLAFLSRTNPLNLLLGRVRHSMARPQVQYAEE